MTSAFSIIETLRDFVARATELGLEYMVTGSFAMSAYGEIRTTRDIDIVIKITEHQASRFAKLFENEYYISDQSVRRAIERRSMFNIINHAHGGKIDCIVLKDTAFALESFARRYKESVSGIEFWTTTKEDLIIAKLNWAQDSKSEMQIRDIANLTSSEYDSAYVSSWIERLQLGEIWSDVGKWKIQHRKIDN